MGAYSAKPTINIEFQSDANDYIIYNTSCMQGWRNTQEDAHCCSLKLSDNNLSALFGVFDGHNGDHVSRYSAIEIPKILAEIDSMKGDKPDVYASLVNCFIKCDNEVKKPENLPVLKSLTKDDVSDSSEGESDSGEESEDVSKLIEESKQPVENIAKQYIKQHLTKLLLKNNGSSNGVDVGCSGDKPDSSGEDENDQKKAGENSESEVKEDSSESDKNDKSGSGADGSENSEDDEESDDEYSSSDEESDLGSNDSGNDPDFTDFTPELTSVTPGVCNGCTACVCYLIPDKTTTGVRLFVANAGDSRAVLARNGKAIDLSYDHKPELPEEKMRIEKAGGAVNDEGRINDSLNLSRAIGDHSYKSREDLHLSQQMIIAFPSVTDTLLNPETDKFIVLACDGIWNSLTSQEVVDFVDARLKDTSLVGSKRRNIEEYDDGESDNTESLITPKTFDRELVGEELLKEICEDLFHEILAVSATNDDNGCDNMTCSIILLKDLDSFAKEAKVSLCPVTSEEDYMQSYQKEYHEVCPVIGKRDLEDSNDEIPAKKIKLSEVENAPAKEESV